jgi:hypothetical protein
VVLFVKCLVVVMMVVSAVCFEQWLAVRMVEILVHLDVVVRDSTYHLQYIFQCLPTSPHE